MNLQPLAIITPNRLLTHEQGKVIYLCWDDEQFCLSRAQFDRFVTVLERGSRYLYAESGDCSVVHVDDHLREVWIGDIYLSLSTREYRALLNATLTTETRLHGFRDVSTQSYKALQTAFETHQPEITGFSWN